MFAAEGDDGRALTAFCRLDTDELIALVCVGKSLLAEETTLSAFVLTVWTWEVIALVPPLRLTSWTDDFSVLMSEQ